MTVGSVVSSGILGHAAILDELGRAIDADALHHAYLFQGPHGVGKATVARYVALRVNCTNERARPCHACPTCRQILAGTHPDVIRLEPSTERASGTIAVEDVREVVRRTTYHRYGSRRRFVIVDPAEAMQPAAANALLKTLEEPPAGTGFILICANAGSLLPTIRSRCQRVRFGAVPDRQIVAWLDERGHGALAERAARLSQGCPGKALALVDGSLAARDELRARLLAALAGDQKGRFDWSQQLIGPKRQDWAPTLDLLIEILEDLLRDAAMRGSGVDLPLLNADQPEVVAAWARALWPDGIRRLHQAIEQARDQLEVMVGGRMVVDALLAQVARELAVAR